MKVFGGEKHVKLKAFILIFLCLLATAAVSVITCIAPRLYPRELDETADFERSPTLLGDPIDTPGGGGKK